MYELVMKIFLYFLLKSCFVLEQTKFSVRTETRPVSVVFQFVSWNKGKKFQSVSMFWTYLETSLIFLQKTPKYALYQTVSVAFLFVSVQSRHRNSLFRYRSKTTEKNILFRIVPKLVSVLVSVVSNRTSFKGHPSWFAILKYQTKPQHRCLCVF